VRVGSSPIASNLLSSQVCAGGGRRPSTIGCRSTACRSTARTLGSLAPENQGTQRRITDASVWRSNREVTRQALGTPARNNARWARAAVASCSTRMTVSCGAVEASRAARRASEAVSGTPYAVFTSREAPARSGGPTSARCTASVQGSSGTPKPTDTTRAQLIEDVSREPFSRARSSRRASSPTSFAQPLAASSSSQGGARTSGFASRFRRSSRTLARASATRPGRVRIRAVNAVSGNSAAPPAERPCSSTGAGRSSSQGPASWLARARGVATSMPARPPRRANHPRTACTVAFVRQSTSTERLTATRAGGRIRSSNQASSKAHRGKPHCLRSSRAAARETATTAPPRRCAR
jgi:hypothetical protein